MEKMDLALGTRKELDAGLKHLCGYRSLLEKGKATECLENSFQHYGEGRIPRYGADRGQCT